MDEKKDREVEVKEGEERNIEMIQQEGVLCVCARSKSRHWRTRWLWYRLYGSREGEFLALYIAGHVHARRAISGSRDRRAIDLADVTA